MEGSLHHLPARPAASDSSAVADHLEELCSALENGAGVPAILRAAARTLEASLALIDPSNAILAVAARSPSEERALLAAGSGVVAIELRMADEVVGQLRLRSRTRDPVPPARLVLVRTLLAAELARVRAPERASEEAAAAFVRDVLSRAVTDRDELIARGKEVGVALDAGASVIVARAHPRAPGDEGWRRRMLVVAERGARSAAPGSLAALVEATDPAGPAGPSDEVVLLIPGDDEAVVERLTAIVVRELEADLAGVRFAVGRSRVATDPADLHRAAHEALLAANVAEGDERVVLAFEETGAYRLLLASMSEHPDELRRFYADTLEKVVAYDEQYETDLVTTLETFLEANGNVAGTAQRLYTHRHTVRYRLERVRELTGLDVASSDGREKLSLGLKAMRVLGIPPRRGPAQELGAEAGRVPREPKDRG
jgi:PucR family transcriptional regulator, purine catabolism regulatory protein